MMDSNDKPPDALFYSLLTINMRMPTRARTVECRSRGIVNKAGHILYRATKQDCTNCPLKQRCQHPRQKPGDFCSAHFCHPLIKHFSERTESPTILSGRESDFAPEQTTEKARILVTDLNGDCFD